MRTVYVFDKSTGTYLWSQSIPDRIYDHAGNCTWDGLNDNMTETVPPDCPTGYHLHWTGTAWETIADPIPETPHVMTEEERWASLSTDQKAEEVRSKRDSMIEDIMWRVERCQTQTALGVTPADSEEQYRDVLSYIESLRQVPEQTGFPDSVEWPEMSE